MTLQTGTHSIETERLILRRIEPGDLEFYVRIQADPEVARYIAHGKPRTRQESEAWLEAVLASYASCALGQLAVVAKASGVLIGRCGLSDAALEAVPEPGRLRRGWFFRAQVPEGVVVDPVPELGYTFARENWGCGYASEASAAVYRYAHETLRKPAVMSVIDADNHASLAVARKHGVVCGGKVELSGKAFDRYDWPMS